MRSCTWWTEERRKRLRDLRAGGMSYRKIAFELGISEGSVRYEYLPERRYGMKLARFYREEKRAVDNEYKPNVSVRSDSEGFIVTPEGVPFQ